MRNFWKTLNKPFFVLAPMENVTDTVFRQVIGSCAPPDVFFTEFTNCDGIFSKGRDKVIKRLIYTEKERPLVAQVWGKNPETYAKAAKLVNEMGFDGIDINMGCPEKNVVRSGAGAGLINNIILVKEILDAVKANKGDIPLSVKTRIGQKEIITNEWIQFLLEQEIDALTLHGRTAKEMSKVPAHWDEIKKAVDIRNSMGIETLIIGNGDIQNRLDGINKANESEVDGLMIGRGIFNDLWLFEKEEKQHTPYEYIEKLIYHIDLFESTWKNIKHYPILKKFYKAYIKNFDQASNIRNELMETNNYSEAREILKHYLKTDLI